MANKIPPKSSGELKVGSSVIKRNILQTFDTNKFKNVLKAIVLTIDMIIFEVEYCITILGLMSVEFKNCIPSVLNSAFDVDYRNKSIFSQLKVFLF